jgi:hypothetical protein
MTSDPKSEQAAAHLYRLAEATALLRMYEESEGREPKNMKQLVAWLDRHPEIPRPIQPTAADLAVNPELYVLASRSNPYFSGPS